MIIKIDHAVEILKNNRRSIYTAYNLQLQEVAYAESHFSHFVVFFSSSLYCDKLLSAKADRLTIVLIYRVNVHCQ